MTPPSSRRNFFLGGRGLPFDFPEVPRALERLGPAVETPVAVRNAGLFRQDEALRRLLTLGYPRLSPTGEGPRDPADMEAAIRSLWDSARQGNRLAYLDAMRGTYLLLHHQMGRSEARGAIPRIARMFSDVTEEYARHIAERAEYSPLQRLTYLFAAARVARLFLGRLSDAEAGSAPEFAGEIAALRGALLRLHVTLAGYVAEAQRAEPTLGALEGIRIQIEMRRAVLEGESDRARSRARELAAFYRAHPPLPEDSGNAESSRFYHAAGRELQHDPEFLNLMEDLNGPSVAEQEGGILNGVALQWLATAASALDQVNEDSEAAIRARYQALSAVATVLALAYPAASLRALLGMLREESGAEDRLALLRSVAARSPEISAYLRDAAGEESMEALWRRARAAADHLEELRAGPGRRVLEAVLTGSETRHPVWRLSAELARQPGLTAALGLPPAGEGLEPRMRNALELLRRGEEGLREVRAYAGSHPGESLQNLIRILEPVSGAATPVNAFAETLLETLQEGLGSHEDHEEAMAQAVFQSVAQSGEIAPHQTLGVAATRHATALARRMEGAGYRGYRVLRHLVAPRSVATLALGIAVTELTPALLIARAGASGRLAAPLLGDLVRAGTLSRRGTFLTGFGTGLGMAGLGTSLHAWHQHRLGLRTHFWRDLATNGAINGITFGSSLLFARAWNRLLAPDASRGLAIGETGLARGLALHGGNALFGTAVGMGLGITARRLQNGTWTTSWDEVAENFATMLLWEGGAAGLRGLRRRVGLNAELGLPDSGRLVPGWNRLPLLGRPTVLGAYRSRRVTEIADRMIQANPSLSGERPFLLRQLGLHEAHAPGSLDGFGEATFRDYELRLAGEGADRRLLMVRRPAQVPPPAAVPGEGAAAAESLEREVPPRERRRVVLDPVPAEAPAGTGSGAEEVPMSGGRIPTAEVDETALTPPRGVPAVGAEPARAPSLAQVALEPGVPLMVIDENTPQGTRRGEHFVLIPGVGEAAAFTHEGVSKHHPARNEDAYGLLGLPDGSVVALAFDGAGGSGAGDLASAMGIRTVVARLGQGPAPLGAAFLEAHRAIQSGCRGGYTVGTGIRVHPDGQVEVATVGDTQLLVARPRGDGSYEVIRPYFPNNMPGVFRASGREISNTLEMNSHPGASRVFGALGTGTAVVRTELSRTVAGNFHPEGIYNGPLTLPERPDGGGARQPYRAQPGDVFLMMSDGVHELFTREQMAEVMQGLSGAGEIRDALQREIEARLETFRISQDPGGPTGRRPIPYGRFQGAFVDIEGDVYPAATGGERIGHVSPDNVVLVALRFDPALRTAAPSDPGAPPQGAAVADGILPDAPAASTAEDSAILPPSASDADPRMPALAPVDSWAAALNEPLLPVVMARVQAGVRELLMRTAPGRAPLDSALVPPHAAVHAEVAIDPATGEVLAAEQADPRRHILRLWAAVDGDRNVIVMDPAALEAFQRDMELWGLSSEDRSRVGSVLRALRDLHGQAIVLAARAAEPAAGLPASSGTESVAAPPAQPADRPPLYTFRLEALRERDSERRWSFGSLLIDSGQAGLIPSLGELREATLQPFLYGAPWSYELSSPRVDVIVHRSYEATPLVVGRGQTERFVIRPGDSVTVSEYSAERNMLGERSVAFIHHRPGSEE